MLNKWLTNHLYCLKDTTRNIIQNKCIAALLTCKTIQISSLHPEKTEAQYSLCCWIQH